MKEKCLKDINLETDYIVKEINLDSSIKRRLLDIGMIAGTKVRKVLVSPSIRSFSRSFATDKTIFEILLLIFFTSQ